MANHVLLNNISHKDLKIITEYGAEYGDNVMCVAALAFEFKNLQAHYPIFFRKDHNTNQFHAVAMLGFEENENLFLKNNGWDARYVPLMIKRQPFLIGYQNTTQDGVTNQDTVIHVDMDSPRISETQGEDVFLPHGGTTEYIQHINSILQAIHNSQTPDKAFIDQLVEFDLIEPCVLDITLNDGSDNRLMGFSTINEDKLNHLNAEELHLLHHKGMLQLIYMIIASSANIPAMVDRKNNKHLS